MLKEQPIKSNRVWAWALALALATSPALAHDSAHVVVPSPYEAELGVPGDANALAPLHLSALPRYKRPTEHSRR